LTEYIFTHQVGEALRRVRKSGGIFKMQHYSRKSGYRQRVAKPAKFLREFAAEHFSARTFLMAAAALTIFISLLYVSSAHAQANVQGTWQTLPTVMPINPVHTALMHNGKIVIVSGSGNYPQQTVFNAGVFDPVADTVTTQLLTWDMFCNGMVTLPDGRAFVMGGNLQYDPFHGWKRTSAYDPATGNFVDMEDMAHGRWYPTSTVLGDGSVLTFSGLDENGGTNSQVEIYKVGVGWGAPHTASWTPPLYPRLTLLPSGKVFYSGSSTQSRTFDPATNSWSDVIATMNYGGDRIYGSSVLLPLTPANGYKPVVMVFGGGNPSTKTTELIDLSAATPAYVYGPPMSQPRIEMNATLLPTGKILTVGGSLNDEDTGTASLNADLYDSVTNTMGSAGANAVPRLYHSVSLLLPDGTVWIAGGNPQRGTYETSMEIYSPPYLFNPDGSLATRPSITTVAPVIGYGPTTFQVQTPDAANIASVVLMKNGAVTHAFDMDQRMVGLNFSHGSGALTITGPPSGNVAPPGYYMLFLINNAGVPSVAQFVQVSLAPTDIPPTGSITSPSTDVSVPAGQSVNFAGSGTAPSGSITGYSWSIRGGSPASSAVQNPGAITFPAPGTYVASLTVTDNAGITDPSPKTRTITVTSNGLVPTLTSAAPNSGVQGLINVDVILTGTNFLTNPVCNFGAGIEINTCTYNSATKITANIDVLANATVGARDIVITDTDTQTATLPNGFTVVGGVAAPAPTLTGVMPNSEFQGANNVTVNLTGTNFQPSPTCNFDSDFGGTINTCTGVSPTQITVSLTISPTAQLGGHNVIVTNADGQSATLINGFTITQDLGDTVKLGAGFTVGALVLNGNAQLNGSALELTDGNPQEDSSAWYATPVNIQNFATDFTFQISPGTTADGFTFALQNNSTAALGISGGGLGYGPDMLGNPGGIPASLALKFDLYDNLGEGVDSTGLYINGASPTTPAIDLTGSGIDLHSGDTFAVHITYDGTNLVMRITDTVTNAVFTNTWPIDIPTTLGGNTAYAGFTGGTGGLTATQSILNWTLSALVPSSAVTITPSGPISFPDTTENVTSSPVVLTVTNSGTAPLNITAVAVTGANAADFAATGTCTGAALAANATCTISATFTPSATGLRQATLQINDNALDSPQGISLSGTGMTPSSPVTIAPSPLTISATQGTTGASQNITVTNTGAAPLHITAVTFTGANVNEFVNPASSCTAAVAPAASCTIAVGFAPTAAMGSAAPTETVTLTDDAATSPQSVIVNGNVTASAFTVTSAPSASTATVNAGQTAQYSLQLTPGPGYSGSVTMTCSGAPSTTVCSVANPIVLTSGSPTTFTVTVTTTARSSLAPYSSPRSAPPAVPYLLLLSVSVSLVLLAAMYGLKLRGSLSSRQLACTTGILVLVLAASGIAGCNGGSSTGPVNPVGTRAGTYTLTLTPSATSPTGQPLQLTPIQLTLIVN
jgi:Domain of unknown function (DUF1929)/Legume lectin domain/PKD domain